MVQITLTTEQSKLIYEAESTVEIVDPDGNRIAVLPHGWTTRDVEEARAISRSGSRRWTTEEMLERLSGTTGGS